MTEKELEVLKIIEEDARIDFNTLAKMINTRIANVRSMDRMR